MLIIGLVVLGRPLFAVDLSHEKWNPFLAEPVKGFGNLSLSPNQTITTNYGLGPFLLHIGAVDLLQAAGTSVYAVRKGIPSWPKLREGFSKLDKWTTTIQVLSDDGILTYFMHLEPSSIPKSLIADIEAKRPIESGTLLGVLFKDNHLTPHVHFGAADCRNHTRLNPQPYVEYKDTEAPTISEISVHRSADMKDLGKKVSGEIDLTLYAHDTVDGLPNKLPLHKVELTILTKTNAVVFNSTVFDASAFPAKASAAKDNTCEYFTDYDGYNGDLGMALYRWRRASDQNARPGQPYALTSNSHYKDLSPELMPWLNQFPGPWDTTKIPNGEYTIRVKAYDAKGNHTDRERVIQIEN